MTTAEETHEETPRTPDDLERYAELRAQARQVVLDTLAIAEEAEDDKGRAALAQRLDSLDNDEILLAMFGRFNAGKSSLINGLLGDRLLVSDAGPCTACLTFLRRPGPDRPADTAEIAYKTEEALLGDIRNAGIALDLLFEEDERALTLDDALVETLERQLAEHRLRAAALGSVEQRYAKEFLQAVVGGWSDQREHLGVVRARVPLAEARGLTAEEQVAVFFEQVVVHLDHPLLSRGLVLADTPGIGSVNQRHTQVVQRFMRQADVVTFVMSYEGPDETDIKFLTDLTRQWVDASSFDKLFFVVNGIDRRQRREKTVGGHLATIERTLETCGFGDVRLFGTSALCGMFAQQLASGATLGEDAIEDYRDIAIEDRRGDPPDPEKNVIASCLPVYRKKLEDVAIHEKARTVLGSALDDVETRLEDCSQGWKARRSSLEKTHEERLAHQSAWEKEKARALRGLADAKELFNAKIRGLALDLIADEEAIKSTAAVYLAGLKSAAGLTDKVLKRVQLEDWEQQVALDRVQRMFRLASVGPGPLPTTPAGQRFQEAYKSQYGPDETWLEVHRLKRREAMAFDHIFELLQGRSPLPKNYAWLGREKITSEVRKAVADNFKGAKGKDGYPDMGRKVWLMPDSPAWKEIRKGLKQVIPPIIEEEVGDHLKAQRGVLQERFDTASDALIGRLQDLRAQIDGVVEDLFGTVPRARRVKTMKLAFTKDTVVQAVEFGDYGLLTMLWKTRLGMKDVDGEDGLFAEELSERAFRESVRLTLQLSADLAATLKACNNELERVSDAYVSDLIEHIDRGLAKSEHDHELDKEELVVVNERLDRLAGSSNAILDRVKSLRGDIKSSLGRE